MRFSKNINLVFFMFFLLCGCSSVAPIDKPQSEPQVEVEDEAKIERIANNLRSLISLNEQTNKSYPYAYQDEQRRKEKLALISKYIRKIQNEYNDPNLDGFISWSTAKYNQTRKAIEISLQVALGDSEYSGETRSIFLDDFRSYEKEMDAYLRKLKKHKCKDKKCSL